LHELSRQGCPRHGRLSTPSRPAPRLLDEAVAGVLRNRPQTQHPHDTSHPSIESRANEVGGPLFVLHAHCSPGAIAFGVDGEPIGADIDTDIDTDIDAKRCRCTEISLSGKNSQAKIAKRCEPIGTTKRRKTLGASCSALHSILSALRRGIDGCPKPIKAAEKIFARSLRKTRRSHLSQCARTVEIFPQGA